MPENPYVALTVSDLDPASIAQTTARSLGSPREVIESALQSYRLLVINQVKSELAKSKEITGSTLISLVDIAGQLYLKRFNTIVGPVAVGRYVEAYRRANAGDVPAEVLYALAEKHSDRLGTYFNETSKEALVEGFNAYVNRQVPARVAADRALDAYGLTPRQMRGYVALAPTEKVASITPRSLKARALEYIGRSIRNRLKIFSTQEIHNIDQQAQQTAWMWMADKGLLQPDAQKIWITAKDEKVCKVCGPMNGKKVGVTEQFKLPDGSMIYTPGVHPNCRCYVRLQNLVRPQPELTIAKADDDWDPKEHPRGGDPQNRGRFSRISARPQVADRGREVISRDVITPALEHVEEEEVEPTPVIETAPELSIPKMGALSMPTVAMPPTLSAAPVLNMSSPALDMSAPTLNTSSKPELSTREDRPTLQLPEKRLVLQDTKQVLAGLRMPERRTVRHRDTIKLGKPVYTILEPYTIGNADRIDITEDYMFTPDESDVANTAYEMFDSNIEMIAEDINFTYGNKIEKAYVASDGERMKVSAEISVEDAWDIVNTVAWKSDREPEWVGDRITIPVKWTDGQGNVVEEENVSYREVIEQWGLHPEMFEVTIVRLDEGHDSSLGHTYMDEAGSSAAYETWRTSGRYWVEDSNKIQFGHSIPLRIVDAIPVAETYEKEIYE
jgi:hypothetical protein